MQEGTVRGMLGRIRPRSFYNEDKPMLYLYCPKLFGPFSVPLQGFESLGGVSIFADDPIGVDIDSALINLDQNTQRGDINHYLQI